METYSTERRPAPPVDGDINKEINIESADKFRKYMQELFDKNGVLNDLRAYLRGQIVQVLKSSQTGIPPMCQKHFTQRLDLKCQALNILIVEYLLCMDFGYSLSVFLSEIPLRNMMFNFAKELVNSTTTGSDLSQLRFNENDIWAILNYLGIKCDSKDASQILESYKTEVNTPLLMILLKYLASVPRDIHSEDNKANSQSTLSPKPRSRPKSAGECEHAKLCRICQNLVTKLKEEYRKRLAYQSQQVQEKTRTAHDTDIEIRCDERELKLAAQALMLQQKQEKMNELFAERERELETKIRQKKQFLWGLATALRDQHAQMSRAMHIVRYETGRLEAKENSLKLQMAEAEKQLRDCGEDMRQKISEEITTLGSYVETIKCEQERVSSEREQLEMLKEERDSLTKELNLQSVEHYDYMRHHYELLRNELHILRKNIESAKERPKSAVERGIVTETPEHSKTSMLLNNEQECERNMKDENVLKPNQVVNELRKQKNVNFSQSRANLLDGYQERLEQRFSETSLVDSTGLKELLEENQRLSALAETQRDRIASLSVQQSRLEAQQARLETERVAASYILPVEAAGCGAGEEIAALRIRPRILVPGDVLPFFGVLQDRHNDRKRQSAHAQLCRLQRPASAPHAAARPGCGHSLVGELSNDIPDRLHDHIIATDNVPVAPRSRQASAKSSVCTPVRDGVDPRPKSPLSLLTEAKQKLRRKPSPQRRSDDCEKSPSSVLREAKLRLRKLEIEAEAVNQCYRDFQQRQAARRSSPSYRERQDVWEEPPAPDQSADNYWQTQEARREELDYHNRQQETPEVYQPPYNEYRHYHVAQRESPIYHRQAVTRDCSPEHRLGTGDVSLGLRRNRSLQKLNAFPMINTDYYKESNHKSVNNNNDNVSQCPTKFNPQNSFDYNENAAPIQEFLQMNCEIDNVLLKSNFTANENYLDKSLTEFRKLYRKPRDHGSRASSPKKACSHVDKFSEPASPKKSGSYVDKFASRASSPKKAGSCVDNFVSRPSSPNNFDREVSTAICNDGSNILMTKNEVLRKTKQKQAEIEILKSNLSKIYNYEEPLTIESRIEVLEHNAEIKSREETEILTNAIKNNNLLLKIENAIGSHETIDPNSEHTNLVVVVESSVNKGEAVERDESTTDVMLRPMRSVISTKQGSASISRHQSPKEGKFTRKDTVIDYDSENNHLSDNYIPDNQREAEADAATAADEECAEGSSVYKNSRCQSPKEGKITRKAVDSGSENNHRSENNNPDHQNEVEDNQNIEADDYHGEYEEDFCEYKNSTDSTMSVGKSFAPETDDFWN